MPDIKNLTTKMALFALAFSAFAACDQSTTAPEPEPELIGIWDIDVEVRYVKASPERTCDGTTLLGNNNPGEFQYRIRAFDGSIAKEMETNNYGRVTGRSHSLDTSENHNFTNQTWEFSNLTEFESVGLWLYSTEWDGTERDDYMNDLSELVWLQPSRLLPVGGRSTDRRLTVGKSTCGLTLYYDIVVVHREEPVGS